MDKVNEGSRDEVVRYNFFADELFGIEGPISKIVEYFKSAGQRLEVRKRILLLMGPVGGGKSTIVTMLKRGLERWSRTADGAVYAIKDCPMHEEPLHLIPPELRPEIEKHYGLYIEGELCPQCRYNLEHVYKGRHEDVLVHRIVFSEKDRIGIAHAHGSEIAGHHRADVRIGLHDRRGIVGPTREPSLRRRTTRQSSAYGGSLRC